MKGLIFGLLFITSIFCVTANRVKRFSGNGQRNSEWNWNRNRNEQLTDGQTKGSSQGAWPTKGNAGSVKGGRGDTNPGRGNDWPSGERRSDVDWNQGPQGNNKGSAYPTGSEEQGGDLETLLRGVPGMDFPNFVTIPKTEFDCSAQPSQGYYGDVEAGCQVFHICQPGNRKDSFLCPVGTIFNQKYFVCDWWFNVNCSDTPSFFDLNNEVYKDTVPLTTEAAPVTTEKTLPWNAQDLDKKRPPAKSWSNPPSTGKQNNGRNDTPLRRGGKTDVSREVSNSWSRSDVQQKEVTIAWGSSSGTSVGTYGSSSTASNSVVPTTKPIWYGIDGQPAKDQSNGMAKRRGTMHTTAPFGTRMKSSTRMGRSPTWTATESYFPATLPSETVNYGPASSQAWVEVDDSPKDSVKDSSSDQNYDPTASRGWFKGDTSMEESAKGNYPTTTPIYTGRWLKSEMPEDLSSEGEANEQSTARWRTNELPNNFNDDDASYRFSATSGWLNNDDIPETSIVPTGIEGVWEQESTGGSNDEGQNRADDEGPKDSNRPTSDYYDGGYDRKQQTQDVHRRGWGHRRNFRDTHKSAPSRRGWFKQRIDQRKSLDNSNVNDVSRHENWS